LNDPKSETLIAYLLGELSEEEKVTLETKLYSDAGLREELESLRTTLGTVGDWIESEPPGLDALERLPVPEPKVISIRSKGWSRLSRFAAQAAAACLIFFCGYLFGNQTTEAPEKKPTPEVVQAPPTAMPTVEPTPQPKPRRGHHRTYEENGRIIIETTLPASGGSAVWVVDGNFRMAGE